MRLQPNCCLLLILTTCVVALPAPASAARLTFGMPNGTNVAYTRGATDTAWKRQATADLPDVGYYGAPALADLDGDGDRDALVGEALGTARAFQNSGSDAAPIWMRKKNSTKNTSTVCSEKAGVKPRIMPQAMPAAIWLVPLSEFRSLRNWKIWFAALVTVDASPG